MVLYRFYFYHNLTLAFLVEQKQGYRFVIWKWVDKPVRYTIDFLRENHIINLVPNDDLSFFYLVIIEGEKTIIHLLDSFCRIISSQTYDFMFDVAQNAFLNLNGIYGIMGEGKERNLVLIDELQRVKPISPPGNWAKFFLFSLPFSPDLHYLAEYDDDCHRVFYLRSLRSSHSPHIIQILPHGVSVIKISMTYDKTIIVASRRDSEVEIYFYLYDGKTVTLFDYFAYFSSPVYYREYSIFNPPEALLIKDGPPVHIFDIILHPSNNFFVTVEVDLRIPNTYIFIFHPFDKQIPAQRFNLSLSGTIQVIPGFADENVIFILREEGNVSIRMAKLT